MTRDQIRKELEAIEKQKHLESPAHLEYEAQQYWDSYEYELCLYILDKVIEINPSKYTYFKRSQTYLKLHEYNSAISDLDTALELDPEYENTILLKKLILGKIRTEKDYLSRIYQ
jgi:lipoprotein NlpI